MPLSPPGFSPPVWPRLGAARGDTGLGTGLAPPPVEIPICWLSMPVRLRHERPYTTAAVSWTGHGTAYDVNTAALAAYRDNGFTPALDCACSADPAVLAHFAITYRARPLMRAPELTINLLFRTDEEKVRILQVQRNQRIKLTGTPPNFPIGAADLIVSGITDEIGWATRRVRWTTRPIIGITPGTPGPWFRVGNSAVGGTDIIPF